MSNENFTKEMRKATKNVHAVSDALVNTKLLFALSNNNVWAEGLLIFYEIFRFLEDAMKRHKKEFLGQLFVDNLERTEAFEKDLKFYLGEDWTQSYTIRNEVTNYLIYLKRLEEEDSDLLMAYVYHLYMGLLSGGQILKRKKQIKDQLLQRSGEAPGYAITDFGAVSIASLKKKVKDTMNGIAEKLDIKKKQRLIEESRRVFEWNNKIIRTVKGTNRITLEVIGFIFTFLIVVYLAYKYFTSD